MLSFDLVTSVSQLKVGDRVLNIKNGQIVWTGIVSGRAGYQVLAKGEQDSKEICINFMVDLGQLEVEGEIVIHVHTTERLSS